LSDAKLVAEAIPVLCRFIVEGKISDKAIIADCCWGITYHSDKHDQIDIIINSGLVPFLAKLLEEKTVDIVIPALRTLGNISTGDAKQTDVLLQNDVVLPKL
jgi:importin subunit alpha-6/7